MPIPKNRELLRVAQPYPALGPSEKAVQIQVKLPREGRGLDRTVSSAVVHCPVQGRM